MGYQHSRGVDPDKVRFPCGGSGVSRAARVQVSDIVPCCYYCESRDSFDASCRCRNCGAEAVQGQVVSVTPKPWRAYFRWG